MKNTRKSALAALVFVLCLCTVLVSGLSTEAQAATVASGDFSFTLDWTLDSNGVFTVSGNGKAAESKYYMSYSLYDTSFYLGSDVYSKIKKVVFKNGVEDIQSYTFPSCPNLTSIVVPASVNTINLNLGLSSLTSITVDSANPYFSSDANGVLFNKNKTELIKYPIGKTATSYTIPSTVTSIGTAAFRSEKDLTNVTIPSSVKVIGHNAFSLCYSLKSIVLPDSVTTVGEYVFDSCKEMTSAVLSNSLTGISKGMFYHCYKLKSITIPNSVKTIGMYAFLYDMELTDVVIPVSVTSIENAAFGVCESMKTVKIMNPFTGIASEGTFHQNTTIVGYPKSTARNYATKNGNAFAALSCAHQYGTEFVTTKKATLTADGVMQKQCKTCTYFYPQTTAISRPVSFSFLRSEYECNGGMKSPTVVIKTANGKTLVNGTDFTYTYETDRKSLGAHTIKVTFKGNYSGTKTMTYYVVPKATSKIEVTQDTNTLNISWKAVKGADGYRVFVYKNGKQIYAKRTTKLTRTVKDLAPGMKYTVRVRAYMNIGDERFYAINSTSVNTATKPTKPILTVKAGKECATLTWSKKNCTNYQIRYSTNENFKDYEYLKVKGSENVSATIKNLESGKKYYFKVRAYKYVGGVRYYGGFSKVKSVTVK